MQNRKLKDPYDPFGAESNGALTSALDVMSFAHDIVMVADDGTTLITSESKVGPQSQDPSELKTSPNCRVSSAKINKPNSSVNQPYSNVLLNTGNLAPTLDNKDCYKDPLRELVLISEAVCTTDKQDTTFLSNVKTLATEATTLDNIKEIQPSEQIRQEHLSPVPLKTQPKTLTTMFKDPKDIVDPVKEREFLKKLEALDETDSEAFDGANYLFLNGVTYEPIKF